MKTPAKFLKGFGVVWVGLATLALIDLAIGQDTARLAEIRTIYVDELGTDQGSSLIREKIRVRLMESGRFRVTENPDKADAILTGAAGVYSSTYGTNGDTHTSYRGRGVLRLVDRETEEVIWFLEIGRSWGWGSASTKVAKKTVKELLEAAESADAIASQ